MGGEKIKEREINHKRLLKIDSKLRVPGWAQSVECPTLAQVMISQVVSSSPVSGSVLTAQNLDLALYSMSSSLSAPPLLALCLTLSLSLSQK